MGQNALDVFISLDGSKIVAPCSLQFDGINGVPSNVITNYTWGGITAAALLVKLSPRSVRSPYVFDMIRSVSFSLQFVGGLYQPADLSIWIPETNFLHRIHPTVINSVTNSYTSGIDPTSSAMVNNEYSSPTVSGQVNVNAQPDSSIYLYKEWDANVTNPHPYPYGAYCVGVFNVQNWEVKPLITGAM